MSVVFCCWKTPFLSSTHQKFSIPENGGETAGILTTIVKTAVANGLYPDEYIIRILKNRNEVISNPEKFLPWNPWMREGIEIKR